MKISWERKARKKGKRESKEMEKATSDGQGNHRKTTNIYIERKIEETERHLKETR